MCDIIKRLHIESIVLYSCSVLAYVIYYRNFSGSKITFADYNLLSSFLDAGSNIKTFIAPERLFLNPGSLINLH